MKEIVETLAERSLTGDLFVDLAEMYLGKHEWGLAFRAVERGIGKGRLSDPDHAARLREEIGMILGLGSISWNPVFDSASHAVTS